MLSFTPEMEILPALVKYLEKQKLNFPRSARFHMKTRVCPKYFVNDCLWKDFLSSDSPQTPLDMICLTTFLTLRLLRHTFNLKLKELI